MASRKTKVFMAVGAFLVGSAMLIALAPFVGAEMRKKKMEGKDNK